MITQSKCLKQALKILIQIHKLNTLHVCIVCTYEDMIGVFISQQLTKTRFKISIKATLIYAPLLKPSSYSNIKHYNSSSENTLIYLNLSILNGNASGSSKKCI